MKDDGSGGDNWTTGAISRAKLQSNHHQQTNIQFFLQAGCPSCRPTNSVKALNGKISHSMDLLTPKSPGVFQLSLTTNSSWLPWGMVATTLISPLMPSTPFYSQDHMQFSAIKYKQSLLTSMTWFIYSNIFHKPSEY